MIALPLSRALGEHAASLDTARRDTLDRAARAEMQRVMSARAQLAMIDSVSNQLDIEPMLLKGGIAAVDSNTPVDLGDVDLLLDAPAFEALSRALDARGYVRDAHVPSFVIANAIPIELHRSLDTGDGFASVGGVESARMERFRRLRRHAPVSHVVYIIQHSTTQHPLRRGHLRDAMLIAGSLASCSPGQLKAIERSLSASPARDVYFDALRFAQALLVADDPAPIHDPFTEMAAAKYALSERWPSGSKLFPMLMHHVPFFIASSEDGSRIVGSYLGAEVISESLWYSRVVGRMSPALARGIALAFRTPYRAIALAVAWVTARGIKSR